MAFELLPEARQRMEDWQELRLPDSEPYFPYQPLPASERLAYELMNWDNCGTMLDLFADDPHPFVEPSLKSRPAFDYYLIDVLDYRHYSAKHGSCDWFLRYQGQYIGVLHLYDLNVAIYERKHPPCFVGYAIAEAHRQQGFAEEALRHLLQQIPLIFERYDVMAEPKLQNVASRHLLQKVGFVEKRMSRGNQTSIWYKDLRDDFKHLTT
ncbi:MAG: GNAT family protein [Spirosomataceae bacterium]